MKRVRAPRVLTNSEFVDVVRVRIGLLPIVAAVQATGYSHPDDSYVRAEALARASDPNCQHCGGYGYYDGWRLDLRCSCTGLEQRRSRANRGEHATRREFVRPRMRRAQ